MGSRMFATFQNDQRTSKEKAKIKHKRLPPSLQHSNPWNMFHHSMLDKTLDEVIAVRKGKRADREEEVAHRKKPKQLQGPKVSPAKPEIVVRVQLVDAHSADVSAVAQKVLAWIRKNPNSRPRTQKRLIHAIEKFCFVTRTVDTDLLFYRMLHAQMIAVDDEKCVTKSRDVDHYKNYVENSTGTDNNDNNNNNDQNLNKEFNVKDNNAYHNTSYALAMKRLLVGSTALIL